MVRTDVPARGETEALGQTGQNRLKKNKKNRRGAKGGRTCAVEAGQPRMDTMRDISTRCVLCFVEGYVHPPTVYWTPSKKCSGVGCITVSCIRMYHCIMYQCITYTGHVHMRGGCISLYQRDTRLYHLYHCSKYVSLYHLYHACVSRRGCIISSHDFHVYI